MAGRAGQRRGAARGRGRHRRWQPGCGAHTAAGRPWLARARPAGHCRLPGPGAARAVPLGGDWRRRALVPGTLLPARHPGTRRRVGGARHAVRGPRRGTGPRRTAPVRDPGGNHRRSDRRGEVPGGPRRHRRPSRSRSRPGRPARSRGTRIAGGVPGRRLGGAVGVALGRGDGQRPARRPARRRGARGRSHPPEGGVNPASGAGGLDTFEGERPRLTGLAYRITCSLADAEDVVQEAWIRWAARDAATVDNPAAWLTTVTSRLALDRLRAQRRRREVYVGPWLPDPVSTARNAEEAAELAESLTLGFLVLLDSLGPSERVAFLLGDVFGEPYPAIAGILGKSASACRQLVSRARRKLHSARGSGTPAPSPASAELLVQLMESVLADNEERTLSLLHPDVVLISDGGPTRHAARQPVVGAERV